jgi:hypothetical protein
MKIKVSQLRRMIREAYAASNAHASHDRIVALSKAAIKDLAAGGNPRDVYAWLAAETDLGDGQHRANAVVVLVGRKDAGAGSKLKRAAAESPMPPEPYRAPWSGPSGKMYESSQAPTVLYHGTLRERVPSILASGLRATEGWGGAASPGVFLSPTREDAEYWATAALLKKLGLPVPQGVELVAPSEHAGAVAVLAVAVPPAAAGNIVPRRKSFSLPGDVQFVGSVPPEWISVDEM